jgi:hypothetical protein
MPATPTLNVGDLASEPARQKNGATGGRQSPGGTREEKGRQVHRSSQGKKEGDRAAGSVGAPDGTFDVRCVSTCFAQTGYNLVREPYTCPEGSE